MLIRRNVNQHISTQFPCIWFLFVSPVRLQVWYRLWAFGGESWRQLPYVDSREHFIFQRSQKISVCLSEPSMFKLKHLSGSVSEAHPPHPPLPSSPPHPGWILGHVRELDERGFAEAYREDLEHFQVSNRACWVQNSDKLATSGVSAACEKMRSEWQEVRGVINTAEEHGKQWPYAVFWAGITEFLSDAVDSGCTVKFWLILFLRVTICPQKWLHNARNSTETAAELKSASLSSLQTFLQRACKKEENKKNTTNRKIAPLLKLLCLSKQSGDLDALRGRSMKASCRHPQPWACYLCVLFIVSPTGIKDIKWNSSEKRKRTGSCLTEGGNRQLAASFGSGGCQGTGEMAEIGSGLKRGGGGLLLLRLSSF